MKKVLLKNLNYLRKKKKKKKRRSFIKENSRKLTVIPERNFNEIKRNNNRRERLPTS